MSLGKRFAPIDPNFPQLLHGGDYNPDQWLDAPEVLSEDRRLMDLASVNALTVGVFSWSAIEPEEGRFSFSWLDDIFAQHASDGRRIILATPSGGKPNWLATRYPEVNQVALGMKHRSHQRGRHNHCNSSPLYREKVRLINTALGERYGKHPALALWHVGNEFRGHPCWCENCFSGFRNWLRDRFNNDLDALNRAWWSSFWSHSYSDWEQIVPPDGSNHGLMLNWRKFCNDNVVDFLQAEIAALRATGTTVPATTNLMGFTDGLNPWTVAPHLDVVSWDAYPTWHQGPDPERVPASTAFGHDLNRSLKRRPFLLIESTPSGTNWQKNVRAKRPGMNRSTGLQALAHGSEGVLYFQWRKGRGGSEKFHGAIVDHVGHEHTRVFAEAAAFGAEMKKLSDLVGTCNQAEVAIIYDWPNAWAIAEAAGPRADEKNYRQTCEDHHLPIWRKGIAVDCIEATADLSPYRVIIAPMLYQLRPGVAEALTAFVAAGGTLVCSYLSGWTDEHDLCFTGGFPGPLRPLLGLWAEEMDILTTDGPQDMCMQVHNHLQVSGCFKARHFAEILHAEGAEVLATYGQDYYAGSPALTCNHYGKGRAYMIATRLEQAGTDALIEAIVEQSGCAAAWPHTLPPGVNVQIRQGPDRAWAFLMNFSAEPVEIKVAAEWQAVLEPAPSGGTVSLPAFTSTVLQR